jgi:hypothetical protein
MDLYGKSYSELYNLWQAYDPDLLMVRGAYCSTHRRYLFTLPFYTFSYYSYVA